MKILYYPVYAAWFLLSLLPLWLLYALSDGFYLVLSKIVRYRYRVIWNNVSTSFPDRTEAEKRMIVDRFYAWLCDYFVETIKLMTMSRQQMRRRMRFEGIEPIERLTAEGRSVGIYLGHYGQWEWITSLPFWLSGTAQCAQIYHPLENRTFDTIFRKVREKRGAVCIPMAESLRKVVEYRTSGTPIILGYISDQVPFWNNIHHWLDFLHHDTPVLTGTERMMKATHQAVFYADIRREKRGYYTCEFKLIGQDPKVFADFQLTDIYFGMLQASIERDPSIYLWSHNRWKRTRQEFNMRYNEHTGRVDLRDIATIRQEKGIR